MMNENNPNHDEEKLYTQEEVDALLTQQETALNDALSQVEALTAQLCETAHSAQEDELTARERRIEKREMHARAVEQLAEKGLPVQLAQALDYTDEEAFAASLETIGTLFAKAVQQGVELRLRGAVPTVGVSAPKTATLRDAIAQRYAGV